MGKNIVQGAIQVNGHSLKLFFLCLKDHKKNVLVWIFINVFGIYSINCKVYMLKT